MTVATAVPVTTEGPVSGITTVAPSRERLVRRPTRGLQLKKDTWASLSLVGESKPFILNSSAPVGTEVSFTSNFILQAVQESRQEKFQPISTFGPTYGFFFGEQPRIMQFSAVLLNTADFQWEIEWWSNYEEFFRGTKLTERGIQAELVYDDIIVTGYLATASTSKSAANADEVPLTFAMWVTNVQYMHEPGFKGPLPIAGSDITQISSSSNISTTAAVRAANLQALNQRETGLLAALRNGIEEVQDILGTVSSRLQSVRNLLYGRNIRIPAGFAGSERNAGNLGQPIQLAPTTFTAPRRGAFYANVDEYLAADLPPVAGIDKPPSKDLDLVAIEKAENTFRSFGFDVTNATGSVGVTAAMLALGRSAYGATVLPAVVDLVTQDGDFQIASSNIAEGVLANLNSPTSLNGRLR